MPQHTAMSVRHRFNPVTPPRPAPRATQFERFVPNHQIKTIEDLECEKKIGTSYKTKMKMVALAQKMKVLAKAKRADKSDNKIEKC
jgi:hypothetical protein